MTRICALLAALLCVAAVSRADEDRPKDAPTLDDQAGTLTKTVDGKPEKTKVDLKYCLKVKGYFTKDGLHVEELDGDGPAAMLHDADGNAVAMMEVGDAITEVDGKKVKSAEEYAKALNGAADPDKVKLKVRDKNTGNDFEYYVKAVKR
jgi:S1-C subfamily serine protease